MTEIEERVRHLEAEIQRMKKQPNLYKSPMFPDAERRARPWTYLTTPLTSTSWDNDQKTTSDRGVIDLSAVFSAPANIKAVLLSLQFTPTTAGDYFRVGPSATYNYALTCRGQVASVITHAYGSVPCDANGDIYFYNSTTTPTVAIMIWGYFL